ncbi:hypothetical protein RRG08_066317 [Elysia crispata]|uniref:C-type lectin domain-containing protein n=1 Tax=Elysia crispata TaxID=231223 RepID=A0AAE1ATG7_9GAST|nr:hypothetical protein RRG08_066317 [Elysia crispata]
MAVTAGRKFFCGAALVLACLASVQGFPRDLLSLSISDLSPLLQAFLPEGCPTSLTSDIYYLQSYKGVCYWFIPYAKRTWLKAGQICSDKGGKYLEIRSEDELDFIVDHMEKTYSFKYPVWLGLKNGFRNLYEWQDQSSADTSIFPGFGSTSWYLNNCFEFSTYQGGTVSEVSCNKYYSPKRKIICQFGEQQKPRPKWWQKFNHYDGMHDYFWRPSWRKWKDDEPYVITKKNKTPRQKQQHQTGKPPVTAVPTTTEYDDYVRWQYPVSRRYAIDTFYTEDDLVTESEPTSKADVATEAVDLTTEPVDLTTEPVDLTTEAANLTTEPVDLTTEPVDLTTEPVDLTTEPADLTTEAADPTTEAADPTTEAVDLTTEAADPTTEAVDLTTEAADPTTEAANLTSEPVDLTTEPADPTTEAADPTTEAVDLTTEAADPTTEAADLTTEPVDLTTEAADLTTEAIDLTTEPVDLTTEAIDLTTDPIDLTIEPVDLTTEPVDLTTEPVDLTTEAIDLTTDPIDLTTEPAHIPIKPVDLTTESVEITTEAKPTKEAVALTTKGKFTTTREDNPKTDGVTPTSVFTRDVTTPEPARQKASKPKCETFFCQKDCMMFGYKRDPVTGCPICECDFD